MKTYYITCKSDGEITGANEYSEFQNTSGLVEFYASQGLTAVEVTEEEYLVLRGSTIEDTHYFDGTAFVQIPAKPSEYHHFDFETKSWIEPAGLLQDLKRQKIDAIDKRRESLSIAPIEFRGAMFDADKTAQANISAWLNVINSGASVPEGFVWRDATNVDHPADAQFVRELATAMTLRGTAMYAASWAHKAAVGALNSVQDVLAYNVQANW